MCQDRGDLWECDTPDCQHAVCGRCVEVPAEELSKLQAPNVTFNCVACHWTWGKSSTPYFVSAFLFLFIFILNIYIYIYLQGFTINGKPVLKSFLKVKGTFETSISAKVFSPPPFSFICISTPSLTSPTLMWSRQFLLNIIRTITPLRSLTYLIMSGMTGLSPSGTVTSQTLSRVFPSTHTST
jgi:hypothetical protein